MRAKSKSCECGECIRCDSKGHMRRVHEIADMLEHRAGHAEVRDDPETVAVDLLTDIAHWLNECHGCDATQAMAWLGDCLRRAELHIVAEIDGDKNVEVQQAWQH